MAVGLGSTFKELVDEINSKALRGEQGYGFVASVTRNSFTEQNWSTYGSTGHIESWTNTSDIRNDCRINDLFIVIGTATDSGNAHMAVYRSNTGTGNLRGECIGHFYALKGATGATGAKGETGDTGAKGDTGNGIESIVQTTTSTADGGENVITVTMTDGTTATFKIKNGSKGSTGATPSTDNFVTIDTKQTITGTKTFNVVNATQMSMGGQTVATTTNVNTALSSAKSYTDTKVANLVNSAPETLDTLGEIATALEENKSVTDTLNNAISNKLTGTKFSSNASFDTYIPYGESSPNTAPQYVATFVGDSSTKGLTYSTVDSLFKQSDSLKNFTAKSNSQVAPSACTTNGFYYAKSSINSLTDADGNPFLQYHSGNDDFRILTTAYSDVWLQQIATDFRTEHIYYRRKQQGTWYPWTEIALNSQIPVNYVTTNTTQEITGEKTFSNDVTVTGNTDFKGYNSFNGSVYFRGNVVELEENVQLTAVKRPKINGVDVALKTDLTTFVEDPTKTYIKYKGNMPKSGTLYDTDNNNIYTLEVYAGDIEVDWGDGIVEGYGEHYDSFYPSHTYTDGKDYHLISISNSENIRWDKSFYYDSGLIEITFSSSIIDTSLEMVGAHSSPNLKIVKFQSASPDMFYEPFYNCSSLKKIIVPRNLVPSYKKEWILYGLRNDESPYNLLTWEGAESENKMTISASASTMSRNIAVAVTIHSGILNLQVGDKIQLCKVCGSLRKQSNGMHARRRKLRAMESYTITQKDIDHINDADGKKTYTILASLPVDMGASSRHTWASGVKDGSYLRRPLSVRIARYITNSSGICYDIKLLSNIVQLGTSENTLIPL